MQVSPGVQSWMILTLWGGVIIEFEQREFRIHCGHQLNGGLIIAHGAHSVHFRNFSPVRRPIISLIRPVGLVLVRNYLWKQQRSTGQSTG